MSLQAMVMAGARRVEGLNHARRARRPRGHWISGQLSESRFFVAQPHCLFRLYKTPAAFTWISYPARHTFPAEAKELPQKQ
jgi:hypothetical protein